LDDFTPPLTTTFSGQENSEDLGTIYLDWKELDNLKLLQALAIFEDVL